MCSGYMFISYNHLIQPQFRQVQNAVTVSTIYYTDAACSYLQKQLEKLLFLATFTAVLYQQCYEPCHPPDTVVSELFPY